VFGGGGGIGGVNQMHIRYLILGTSQCVELSLCRSCHWVEFKNLHFLQFFLKESHALSNVSRGRKVIMSKFALQIEKIRVQTYRKSNHIKWTHSARDLIKQQK
jgi:hypothetical protein